MRNDSGGSVRDHPLNSDNSMNRFIRYVEVQLAKRQLYRRILMAFVCWLTAYLTFESLETIQLAIERGSNLMDLAGALATANGPLAGILGFAMKLYWGGRDVDSTGKPGN